MVRLVAPTIFIFEGFAGDKGIVIEYRVNCVSVSGIDFPVTVDACYVVASLDTYREYAKPLRKTGLLAGSDAWFHELTTP